MNERDLFMAIRIALPAVTYVDGTEV